MTPAITVGCFVRTPYGKGRVISVDSSAAPRDYLYRVVHEEPGHHDGYYRFDELTAWGEPDLPAPKYPATLVPGMPHDAAARKQTPVYSGVLAYFPHALAEVAKVSYIGNDKHSPGKVMTWDRSKSTDEMDADIRHTIDEVILRRSMEAGKHVVRDADGNAVLAQAAWRVLARLEKDIEAELAAIAAKGSK